MKKVLTSKQRAALDALGHGLTGQPIGVPSHEFAAYELHAKQFFDECQPANPTEIYLVQTIADTSWWRKRITTLETNLLRESIVKRQASVPAGQPPLTHISAMTMAYCDQMDILDKLGRHQERLSILFSKSLRQLTKIQANRRELERNQSRKAASAPTQDAFDRGNCYRA